MRPTTTTGVASARASHCQLSNCRAGTIDNSTTGIDSSAEISTRLRSESASPWSCSSWSSCSCPWPSRAGGVAGGLDLGDEVVDRHAGRRLHPGLLGGEVDRRRHPVELVEPLLDPRRARRARHPLDPQVDFHDLTIPMGGTNLNLLRGLLDSIC